MILVHRISFIVIFFFVVLFCDRSASSEPQSCDKGSSEPSCIVKVDTKTATRMSRSVSPFAVLLKRHIQQNPYAGYVTMATVENSRPRARTVLFQGIAENADGSIGICIKTHAKSSKVTKADSAAVELVWWMEQTSCQFRFHGDITYDDEAQRMRVWNSLNPAAKSQFFYDASAGLDVSTNGPLFLQEQQLAQSVGLSKPPDTFVVGVLLPSEVDFLDLNTLKRVKWVKEKDAAWTETTGYAPPVVSTVL